MPYSDIVIHEHLRCENYDSDSKAVEIIRDNENFRKSVSCTFIVYILSGTVSLSYGIVSDYVLSEGDFMLFPPGTEIVGAVEKSVKILILKIKGPISLCCRYSLEKLYAEQDCKTEHTHLEGNGIVKMFMEGFAGNIENGVRCIRFIEAKTQELLYYLRFYYSEDELARFYIPMLGADAEFMNTIWKTYRKARNVEELARISHKSLSAFQKKFKHIVGKTAGEWFLEQKIKNVYYEICLGEKQLKEISKEYHFSSPSHLGTFCKMHFGKLPSDLKREKTTAQR